MSKYLKSGKLPKDKLPKLKIAEYYCVDMWGNWIHYEDWYGSFEVKVQRFINDRQSDSSHFNKNYIKEYKSFAEFEKYESD